MVSRFPWPLVKGDKLRAYNQIKRLSDTYDIYLCALSDEKVSGEDKKALDPFCSEIQVFRLSRFRILLNLIYFFLFTRKPIQVGYFYNRRIEKKLHRFIRELKPNHIICQLIRTSEYVRRLEGIPKTLDYMDALSAGMERRSENTGAFMRKVIQAEAIRLKKYEHEIFHDFDHCTIISASDRKLIFQYNNEDIHIIPNGIDSEYFKPVDREKSIDLLFTGNMAYPPNVRTAEFLVRKIMPIVWEIRPETTLMISGSSPVNRVKALRNKKVTVVGWVDDIRNSYTGSKVFIAPMIIGSGLQNKLLEAMAMKLPCITSELANLSLDATEGKEILIGRDAKSYAALIISLLEDERRANALAENGHKFAISNFSWSIANEALLNVLKDGKSETEN